MYGLTKESLAGLPIEVQQAKPRLRRPGVAPNVVYLGFTSLFTDISSEMVNSILPLYLLYYLGFTTFGFGVIDGLYQGASAVMRVGGGFAADRWLRHKELAFAGYAVSAVSKLALLAAGRVAPALGAVILIDRAGKGVRTAPRDALISLSSSPDRLGTAFGVHRTLDTLGALLGPVLAFALLSLTAGAYDAIFVTSFCFALIGLGVLVFFVRNRSGPEAPPRGVAVSVRAFLGLLRISSFRTLAFVGATLSLFTISDGFIYLSLQNRLEFSLGLFPLLYVGTSLFYFLLALPAGQLADRIGRRWVFLGGQALLLAVYLTLLLPSVGLAGLLVSLVLFGGYYAATDGVLMAAASAALPASLRASGLAGLTTATGACRAISSLLMGALWIWHGMEAAVAVMAAFLLLSALAASLILRRWAVGIS